MRIPPLFGGGYVQACRDKSPSFDPGLFGCHGNPSWYRLMPYLDRVFLYNPPLFHMAVLGPLKTMVVIMVGKADGVTVPEKWRLSDL